MSEPVRLNSLNVGLQLNKDQLSNPHGAMAVPGDLQPGTLIYFTGLLR